MNLFPYHIIFPYDFLFPSGVANGTLATSSSISQGFRGEDEHLWLVSSAPTATVLSTGSPPAIAPSWTSKARARWRREGVPPRVLLQLNVGEGEVEVV
jgi:hypothetical protein